MTAHDLLTTLQQQGFTLTPLPGGKLEVRPASKLPEELREELKRRKVEVLALLNHQQNGTTSPQCFTPGNRDFLSRPLGQENNPDPWDAWAPFFDWLREHHEERFTAICEAEESIRDLERAGITEGQEYEAAGSELSRRFEAARRLKFKEGFKIWMQ